MIGGWGGVFTAPLGRLREESANNEPRKAQTAAGVWASRMFVAPRVKGGVKVMALLELQLSWRFTSNPATPSRPLRPALCLSLSPPSRLRFSPPFYSISFLFPRASEGSQPFQLRSFKSCCSGRGGAGEREVAEPPQPPTPTPTSTTG